MLKFSANTAISIRLLSKQRYFEEFIGAYGAQDRSVHVVHEDPSTEATQKLPKERMFRKKSILFIAIFCMTTSSVADDWMDAPDKIIDSLRALVEKVKKESDDQSKESAKEFDRHCKSMIKILDR